MSIKKNILLLIISVIALGIPSLMMLQGQTSEESSCPTEESKTSKHSTDEIKKDFPYVEYANERFIDEGRAIKSEKYNKYKVLEPDISKDSKEVLFADWLTTTSPLPVSESQIVVLGKVMTAQAYLSSNKNSVYSEFEIEIEKIFKNGQQKFQNGKYINAEREGGIVRFASGKETWYLVSGQQMPKVGSEYIFFLTHEFPLYGYQKQDLFILTAYELRNGQVFPLDNPDGGTHPAATFYKGKKESVLLDDLQNALKNSTSVSPK